MVGCDKRLTSRGDTPFSRCTKVCRRSRCSLVTPCYGRTSQALRVNVGEDFGQFGVTWLFDDGGRGRRRRRATFDQTVIRGSEPHDMIRRGNICSTSRASDSNHEQGRDSKMAERVCQTFSVNRLADGPCRQCSFLNSIQTVCLKTCLTASAVFYAQVTEGNGRGLCGDATSEGILRCRRVKDRCTASRSFFDAVCF